MDSYEFERLLVCSMISKGNCVTTREIVGSIDEGMIHNFQLRAIYRIASSLITQGEALDGESVFQSLPENVREGFIQLFSGVSAGNIEIWAQRVRQCFMLRDGVSKLKQALSLMEGATPQTLNAVSGEISGLLAKVSVKSDARQPKKVSALLMDYMEVHERRLAGAESGLYLKTGIDPLDEKYGGFDRTDLIVVAARPGMGKTELAISIANHVGSVRGKGCFFSLEMSDMQVVERHVADRGNIPLTLLRNPLRMEQEDYTKMSYSFGSLMEEDNYVIDGSFTADQIIAHASKLNEEGDLSFIAIDYLQLVTLMKAERRDVAIGDVTRKLKLFALESKVPVILISQLNRNVENRPDKRPVMADLKESGSIEQDADVIIFPYRDEVYNEHSPMRGICEIIVGKYRSGQPGTVYMSWNNGHFKNIHPQELERKLAKAADDADRAANKRGGQQPLSKSWA